MKVTTRICLAAALALAATGPAPAASLKQWWPLKVFDVSSGKDVPAECVPLPKAEKPWNSCVLFPHLKGQLLAGCRLRRGRGSASRRREHDAV